MRAVAAVILRFVAVLGLRAAAGTKRASHWLRSDEPWPPPHATRVAVEWSPGAPATTFATPIRWVRVVTSLCTELAAISASFSGA